MSRSHAGTQNSAAAVNGRSYRHFEARNTQLWLASLLFILILAAFSTACGGGGGEGGHHTTPPPQGPTLSSISPSSISAGAPDLTLQATGSNFAAPSLVEWNGSALQTTFVSATQLTATVPATLLTSPGGASVTVSNSAIGGGKSAALTFTINPPRAANTWVRALKYVPKDIAWDAAHGKLLASMGAKDPDHPNTLLVINPVSGTVEKIVPAGNDPNLLSVSSDGSFLYVGQDGDSGVQRYTLPDLQKDIFIPLPANKFGIAPQAVSLEASRVNPHTVAVDVGGWSYSPPGWGVYVFDDAVQRACAVDVLNSPQPFIDWLQWGKDDSLLYGMQYTTIDQPGGVLSMSVDACGVSKLPGDGGFPGGTGMFSYFLPETGLMYSYLGVADPAHHSNVGMYNLLGDWWQCVPDASTNRYYCVVGPQLYGPGAELWVFDLTSYRLLQRLDLARVPTGMIARLVRWGKAGLALISVPAMYDGDGGLFLIDGAAVNANASPDTSSGTAATVYPLMLTMQPDSAQVGSGDVTVTVTGQDFTPDTVGCWNCNYLQMQTVPTTYVSPTKLNMTIPAQAMSLEGSRFISVFDRLTNSFATNSLTFSVLPAPTATVKLAAMNLDGMALAWDKTRSLLYVATGGLDRAYPSSIVAVDPKTATVKSSVQVSSFPYLLDMSAQDKFLYVGYWKASVESQLTLPGFNPIVTWPLSNPAFAEDYSSGNQFYAGDLKAAPQDAHTSVVTLYNFAFKPNASGGVTIYDDQVQRPDLVPGWGGANDINTLAWGKTDSILMGSQNEDAGQQENYFFNVNSWGVSLLRKERTPFNDVGALIHSDFGTGLVYSDDGNVADPTTGQIVGNINAAGFVIPDSSVNRIFVFGQTQAQANTDDYTIAAFDQTTYNFVSMATVPNLLGSPIGMSRCGTNCFAVITFNGNWGSYYGPVGMLYLVTDTTLLGNSVAALRASNSLAKGDLAFRWKRLSRSEIMESQQPRRRK